MLAWIFCRSSLQQTRNNFCLPSDIIHKYGIRKAPEKCTSFQLTHFICPASLFACTLCSLFMALIFSLCSAPRSERWSCRLIQADCNGVRSGWNERDGRVFFFVASCCDTHCEPEHVSGLQTMLREGSSDNRRLYSCKNELASVVLLSVWKRSVFLRYSGGKRKTAGLLSVLDYEGNSRSGLDWNWKKIFGCELRSCDV